MKVDCRNNPNDCAYRVFVDGADVSDFCYAADDLAGTAECYLLNEKGEMVINFAKNDVLTRTIKGRVEIREAGKG